MMMRRFLVLLAFALAASTALAEPPPLVPYVGYLDYGGAPVNGNIAMQFKIVDAAGATKWGPETYDNTSPVAVVSGRFSVALGTKTPIPASLLQGTSELYITVSVGTINGTNITWVPLSGKQRLLATPYALTAATAKDLNVSGNLVAAGTITATGSISTSGSIGVGVAAPTATGVEQFPDTAGDKIILFKGHGLGISTNDVSVFVPDATHTFSVRDGGNSTSTQTFKVTGGGDVSVPGAIDAAHGISQGKPTYGGGDLGVYQNTQSAYIRYVTNGGLHAWYTDGNYGTNTVMYLDKDGKLGVPKCRICMRWHDANGSNGNKGWACVRMIDGESSGWFNLAGTVDGNDQFSMKFLCDGGSSSAGTGDGP